MTLIVKCPACGSEVATQHFDIGLQISVITCPTCGFGNGKEKLNKADLHEQVARKLMPDAFEEA